MNQKLNASILSVTSPLSINQFVSADTPGNVGVCLSGGGSRALTAGMGQLRALNYLKTADGKPLLQQVKAISTVSGGSWVGSTFMYLDSSISIDDYLNKFVADPAQLTTSDVKNETDINYLPAKNIGSRITSRFDAFNMLMSLITYHLEGIDCSLLWQTLVGNHILQNYSLYPLKNSQAGSYTFTYDADSKSQIVNNNPTALKNVTFALMRKDGPAFVICNSAMFVKIDGDDYRYLAPVQSTPFYTGIMSSPAAEDADNRAVGGGGVSSFAFNSELAAVNGSSVQVNQQRQWSLADAIGTSSAFFASAMEEYIKRFINNPAQFVEEMHAADSTSIPAEDTAHDNILQKIKERISADVEKAKAAVETDFEGFISSAGVDGGKFINILKEISNLVPTYKYWPVNDITAQPSILTTDFADAGNLENTGLASLLACSDIDSVIVFVNSSTPLKQYSVEKEKTNNLLSVEIDSQIPPLFGYLPYDKDRGYELYSDVDLEKPEYSWNKMFRFNKIFKSDEFENFLFLMVQAAGNNLNTNSAIIEMKLQVLDNEWFGIKNRGTVNVVWTYNNKVTAWENQLSGDVRTELDKIKNFPCYSTFNTQLSGSEVNLLANLTAWSVGTDKKDLFIRLFTRAV
jgi:hypothetical protein